MKLRKMLLRINSNKKFILMFILLIWFLFVCANKMQFQATSDLTDVLAMSKVDENDETYVVFEGEMQAKQYRVHSFEIRLKKKTKPQKINVTLLDENGTVINSSTYVPEKKAKRFTISDEVYIKPHKPYKIAIQVYSKKEQIVTSCKIYYDTFLILEYIAAVCISFLALLVLISDVIRKKGYLKRRKRINFFTFMLIVSQAGISFWTVEYIFQNDMGNIIRFDLLLRNYGCYLAVYLILLFIMNSSKWSVILGNCFFIIWGMANQYVYLFKGQALMPVDLKSIRTAASVASKYEYTLTHEMCLAISIAILLTVLWLRSAERKLVLSRSYVKQFVVRGLGLVLGFVLFFGLMKTDYIPKLGMNLDMWISKTSYHENGTFLSFFGYWHLMQVQKPENYSVESVIELVETSEKKMIQTSDMRPNIVVVMNEAFVDLSNYGYFETNVPYMKNYDAIYENAIKGHALVNIFGGGTANSEFEYLTGHSLLFMSSSIPYAQHIQEGHDSVASNLVKQGYDTTAIHPLDGTNWRRNAIYPYFGFDDFIAMEHMDKKNAQHIRQFISDGYTYELVMDILQEDTDTPDFVFDVTVQNHSGYAYTKDDFEEEVWVKGFDSLEVSQYLTLMKKSDEALGELIKELESFPEPTILVFFGDHYPRVPDEFMAWINQEHFTPSLETFQKKYSVPFFIWANYDIEEEQNVITSLNYLGAKTLEIAGCELSEYDHYRLKLAEEILAVNAFGYVDKLGIHHYLWEDNSVYEKLQQYWCLMYNELFDTKNKVKKFFDINVEK